MVQAFWYLTALELHFFLYFLHALPQKRVYFSGFHVTNKRGMKCILRSFFFNQWHELYFHSRILSILKQREEF